MLLTLSYGMSHQLTSLLQSDNTTEKLLNDLVARFDRQEQIQNERLKIEKHEQWQAQNKK